MFLGSRCCIFLVFLVNAEKHVPELWKATINTWLHSGALVKTVWRDSQCSVSLITCHIETTFYGYISAFMGEYSAEMSKVI